MKGLFSILFLSIVLLTSCKKDWLDLKPDDNQTTPVTLGDLEAMMDNTNVMNVFYPVRGEIASDGHLANEDYWSFYSDAERTAYTWTYTGAHRNVRDWNYPYQSIFYCNLVLEGLAKIHPADAVAEQQWNRLKGDALFQRAMLFYQLAQTCALAYDVTTASTDVSIPLRLQSDITLRSGRSTIKETYDRIEQDVLQSIPLLPGTPTYKTRGSKPAAYAFLARFYLCTGDYNKALKYAQWCLQSNDELMNFNQLDTNADFPMGLFNSEVLFHACLTYDPMLDASGALMIDTALYNLYDADDLRKKLFFSTGNSGQITFRGMYSNSNVYLFCGPAVDEVYLIRAECYARIDSIAQAMNDLNTLRQTRWKNTVSYPALTAVTPTEALSLILLERKKELLLRGLRWTDIRRLSKDPRFAVVVKRTVQGKHYTLLPTNSFRYALPIPDDVLEFTGMQQNAGW